jgi:hypothetical protein
VRNNFFTIRWLKAILQANQLSSDGQICRYVIDSLPVEAKVWIRIKDELELVAKKIATFHDNRKKLTGTM